MIHKEGSDWVNFNSKEKDLYRSYSKSGVWDVENTFGIHIIQNDLIPFCVSSLYLGSKDYEDGDWDILLSNNLKTYGHRTQMSNTNYYGGII